MSMQEAMDGAVAPKSIQAAAERPAFPRRARVLIVDDIAENRLVLGLYCDQFGVAHESVESGREAVDAAQSGRFDVILMDIFMPKMDGMAATRAIQALPGRIGATPIIAVTTAAGPGESLRYLSCGMIDVVAKPIHAARLAEALGAAFAQVSRERRSSRRQAGKRSAERLTA